MPRKLGVGMPKRKKKKVEVAAAVATEPDTAPAAAVAEMPPPPSPKQRAATSQMRAPPPSPGAVKQRLLKAAVRKAQEAVREASKCVKQSKAELRLAFKTFNARMKSIKRAQAQNRKRSLDSYKKVIMKLWDADIAMQEEVQMHLAGEALFAEETVKLRDAQIALLRFQLRRKSRRGRMARVLGIV